MRISANPAWSGSVSRIGGTAGAWLVPKVLPPDWKRESMGGGWYPGPLGAVGRLAKRL